MSTTDVLADYVEVDPFAVQVKRHPRTVRRWMQEPDGLPYLRLGNRVLIHVPTAREWLFNKIKRPNPRT
jgi:hypothetical protein